MPNLLRKGKENWRVAKIWRQLSDSSPRIAAPKDFEVYTAAECCALVWS